MPDLPRVVDDVRGWYAASMLAIGERVGLLDALLAGGGTSKDLADRAKVDRRNAAAWGDAMVSAGYARRDGDRYQPMEDAIGPLRGGFPFDLRAVVGFLGAAGGMFPRVERAVRDGKGIASSELQATLGDLPSRINAPMYEAFLASDWVSGIPGVEARLRRGIDVGELASGSGMAIRVLASAFPASRFVGYELDPAQVATASMAAAADGLANVRFDVVPDELPATSLDLACIFDALHHLARPDAAIESVLATLRADGSLLIAEATVSGDPNLDAADPTALLTYASSLLYCLQEGLADGGAGLGATWGEAALDSLLSKHGLVVRARYRSPVGYTLTDAVRG